MPERPSIDPAEIRRAIEREMNSIANDVLLEAKRQVPVDKGMLRRSGVKLVGWIGDRIVANISFNTPYAAVQHEDRTLRHPRGGKAKYLEDPLRAFAPQMKSRLEQAYRRAIGS